MWHSTIGLVPSSARLAVSASVTAALSAGSCDHVVAVSSVSASTPASSRVSRRRGRGEAAALPRAGGLLAARLRRRAWRSTARRVGAGRPASARSRPRTSRPRGSRACRVTWPPIAALTRVSVSSLSRRTVGTDAALRRARGARPRRTRSRGSVHAPYASRPGTGRMRTVTSVITPNAPSEPRNSWRRSGRRRSRARGRASSSPSGVATRRACDQVVEPPVAAGGLPARAGRGEAADRGVLGSSAGSGRG